MDFDARDECDDKGGNDDYYKKRLRIEAPVFNSLSLKFDEILNSLYAERLNFIYAEL